MRFSSMVVAFVLGSLSSLPAYSQPAPNYLQITTGDGKNLAASVRAYKGLGDAVIVTLVKEGKMVAPPPSQNPPGQMTFYLDKNQSSDFLEWTTSNKGGGSSTTARFQWYDANGTITRKFYMRGVYVYRFIPNVPRSSGGTLILLTDHIEADPPFNFSPSRVNIISQDKK